ncbi:hypothetical protein DY000_02053363 [Brassica cretica]|uniref:Uncharacterized protein n=1 Tax=Brassica cretica TaxID=69181 RepID=A0ABQ7AFX4_BRACR|nr:hypothetical protein DY000_02053363 [Brassica cretica]
MYELSGFDVTRSNSHFKLCDSVVSIRLNEFTKMVEVAAVANPIPTEMFRFRTLEELMALANTNVHLPAMQLCATVCVSVFDSVAELLHKRLEAGVVQPRVMVATNINPKFVGGRLYLNATSGTHFYFDNEVTASRTLFEQLSTRPENDTTNGKQYRGVKKLEPVSLGELNNCVLNSPPQSIEFLCKARIVSLETTNGWCYISCANCVCCIQPAMSKLIGVRAAEVANPMGQGEEDPLGYQIPQFLQDIVGNAYIFHLKLTEFNFSGNHKSFTVARIFDPNDRIPGPTFAPHGGDHNPDDDMPGSKCASSKCHVGCSSGGDSSEDGEKLSSEQQDSVSENVHGDASGSPDENPAKRARLTQISLIFASSKYTNLNGKEEKSQHRRGSRIKFCESKQTITTLQPPTLTCSVTNGVAKHLDRRPWLRPEYIRRSYSPSVASEESLGKSARARRRSICQLKKRQPINQGQLQCLKDSTRETLNPTPATLPANQRRAQTSTKLSCSKTKTALRIPEEYSIGSSSATNSTTETGENIATTKKARAMRMKLRATKTSGIAKRLPRDAGIHKIYPHYHLSLALEKDHARLEKDHARLDLDHEVSQNDRDFSLLARLPHTARTGDRTDGLIDPFDQFMHFDQPNLTKARILHLSEDIGHTWSSMVHDLNMVVHTDSPTSVVLLTAVHASGYN